MLMCWGPVNGGLSAEESVESIPGQAGLLSVWLRLCTRNTRPRSFACPYPQRASVCRTDAQDPRRAFLIASSIAASLCVSSQRTTGVVGVRADGQPSCREIPVRPLDRALLNFGIVKRQ